VPFCVRRAAAADVDRLLALQDDCCMRIQVQSAKQRPHDLLRCLHRDMNCEEAVANASHPWLGTHAWVSAVQQVTRRAVGNCAAVFDPCGQLLRAIAQLAPPLLVCSTASACQRVARKLCLQVFVPI